MKKIYSIGLLITAISLICLGCGRKVEHTKGKFVFSSIRDATYGQYLYRNGELRLFEENAVHSKWSSDGKLIANCATSQDSYEDCKHIYIFDEYGNKIKQIDTPVGVDELDWFPDGKKIIYIGYPSRRINDFTPNLIYVYDFEINKHTKIYGGEEKDRLMDLQYSPNGDKVLFLNTAETDRNGIWIMDSGGSNLVHITRYGTAPSWFPDGKNICIFTWRDSEGKDLDPDAETNWYYKYNLENKTYEKLLPNLGFCFSDKISRDGKYLYFARQEAGGRVINVVPLFGKDKGKTFPIIPEGKYGYDGYPDWYPR